MLKRVIDSPWFQFVRSLFDNIFVFHQFASTLLMTASTVFSIRLLFNNVVVLRFISTLLETAISNVDCTFVEMECSFDKQFQFFLEVCASCRTAKWKGESIMLKCDWLPFVLIHSLTLWQHFRMSCARYLLSFVVRNNVELWRPKWHLTSRSAPVFYIFVTLRVGGGARTKSGHPAASDLVEC